jgi:hypothetical protein
MYWEGLKETSKHRLGLKCHISGRQEKESVVGLAILEKNPGIMNDTIQFQLLIRIWTSPSNIFKVWTDLPGVLAFHELGVACSLG